MQEIYTPEEVFYTPTTEIDICDMPTVKHAAIDTNRTVAMPVTPSPDEPLSAGPCWALHIYHGTYVLVFYTFDGLGEMHSLEFAMDTPALALFARTLEMRCRNLDARGPMPTESQVL